MNTSIKPSSQPPPHARSIGRYVMYHQIGSGGMATVHFGRLRGPGGFARTVAIKRLHPHLAANPQFASVIVSEARLVARIRHPNVVSLLDVIALDSGELLLVMDYVHGETLAALLGSARLARVPLRPALASAIMLGALEGLHAAHEAMSEGGQPLGLVHGDISPRNIIVDSEGGTRVLDFGVAKSGPGAAQGTSRLGTPGYMSPEKLTGDRFDRRSDVFSAGAVLWEMLCLRRLFPRSDRWQETKRSPVIRPSAFNPAVSRALDAVVLRALAPSREDRFPTTREFAAELERACPPAPGREVSAWVTTTRGPELERRARELARIETVSVAEALGNPGEATVVEPAVRSRPAPFLPAAELDEPTVIAAPDLGEDRPTAIEASAVWWSPPEPPPPARRGVEDADTVCEHRPSGRLPAVLATPTVSPVPPIEIATPARLPRALRLPALRLPAVPRAVRSALPALALLGLTYAVAAANGKRGVVPAPAPASVAPVELRAPADGPSACLAPEQPVSPPAAPAVEAPAAVEAPIVVEAATEETAPDSPPAVTAAPSAAATVIALNRKAIAAYEQLETSRALRLLWESLRHCQRAGLRRGELAAVTHLNLGIVLAGGFKQRGLAVQQFRRAISIRPGIQPSGRLVSPDITAAFAEAGAGERL